MWTLRTRHRAGRDMCGLELPTHQGDDEGRVPGMVQISCKHTYDCTYIRQVLNVTWPNRFFLICLHIFRLGSKWKKSLKTSRLPRRKAQTNWSIYNLHIHCVSILTTVISVCRHSSTACLLIPYRFTVQEHWMMVGNSVGALSQ